MKYLLDTVCINTYLKFKNDFKYGKDYPKVVNLQNLISFIEDNSKNLLVHSATLFELYAKCFKNSLNQEQIKNNCFDLSQFVDDYKYFYPLKIKVINEKPACYFDMNLFVNHINEKAKFDPFNYINAKIDYETNNIYKYISLVVLICSEVLFDTYGDTVDKNIFETYLDQCQIFIRREVKKYLNNYYFGGAKVNESVKSIDYLLYYVLTEVERSIKNKTLLVTNANEALKSLTSMLITWSKKDIGQNQGAEKGNFILKEHIENSTNYSDIESLISGKLNEFYNLEKNANISPLEREYMLLLLNKTLKESAKISKNDFSDYLIVSSCDYIKQEVNDELVFVTFDNKLKKFIEQNGTYYNKNLYKNLCS